MLDQIPGAQNTLVDKDEATENSYPGDILTLEAARDAAIQAAQIAVYNTTRLTRVLSILSEPAPLRILLDRLLHTLSELFSADIVVLLDPTATGSFVPVASIGLAEDQADKPFLSSEGSYLMNVMETGIPITIPNASADPQITPYLRQLNVKTIVLLPVTGSYAPRGALLLARCQAPPFSKTDVNLLSTMTPRIGLVLEKAHYSIQIEQIARTGKETSHHLDLPSLCNQVTNEFPSLIGADAAVLSLVESQNIDCTVTLADLDSEQKTVWFDLTKNYLLWYFQHNREPINVPARNIPGNPAIIGNLLSLCPIRVLLAVPIIIEGQTKGFLFGVRFSEVLFDPDTVQIAMLYAGQVSAALDNASLYRAVRDELAVRQRAEQALRVRDEKFSAMIRSVSDVIAILDECGKISYASPAVETVWGYSVELLNNVSIFQLVHEEDRSTMQDLLSSIRVQPGSTLTGLVHIRQNNGQWRVFEVILTNLLNEPAVSGIISTFHDITERKKYEQELTSLAYRDALTGLANRAFFSKKLGEVLDKANRASVSVGLIFFDLDNFKIVNDSLGHDKGDEVLKIIASRVLNCLRFDDTAARFGGDEFTVLIDKVEYTEQVTAIARRILRSAQDPIHLMERDIYVNCSVGIAFSTPREDTPDDLLRKADLAMYHAKSNGKGCYSIFDARMNEKAFERFEVETELRQALSRNEFRVFYQPIVSLLNHQIIGAEALIRWQHPTRGLILPAAIIPFAEETGLVVEIGRWVMGEACQRVKSWQKQFPNLPLLSLSINLSVRQFNDDDLIDDIHLATQASQLSPTSLILEVTENNFYQDTDSIALKVEAIRERGVRVAIDNLGTRYSCLKYIKQYPVDILKIDRMLIDNIGSSFRNNAIAQGMIDLAYTLGMDVIAEGIETHEQATQLLKSGCYHAQGDFFSPPMPAEAFETLLSHSSS
jgi:diguanylate cyclase (GGDEF)-like protein/PAS domain S-box-containing protein